MSRRSRVLAFGTEPKLSSAHSVLGLGARRSSRRGRPGPLSSVAEPCGTTPYSLQEVVAFWGAVRVGMLLDSFGKLRLMCSRLFSRLCRTTIFISEAFLEADSVLTSLDVPRPQPNQIEPDAPSSPATIRITSCAYLATHLSLSSLHLAVLGRDHNL